MDDDAFCIYCQREFASPANLRRHLRTKHKGTHAQVNLAPDPEPTQRDLEIERHRMQS